MTDIFWEDFSKSDTWFKLISNAQVNLHKTEDCMEVNPVTFHIKKKKKDWFKVCSLRKLTTVINESKKQKNPNSSPT